MRSVQFNKKWEIDSREDYNAAIESLNGSWFVAEMSDSYALTVSEQREINKQKEDVIRQAIEKGIIKG